MDELIQVLNSLGFTENEAKVYITLLKSGAQNGYETSKLSGVPRSRVYIILEALVSRGILVCSHNGKNNIYKAEPASKIERMAKNDIEASLRILREETDKISIKPEDDQIWHLENYERILLKLETMIDQANSEILVQIWAPELNDTIAKALKKKEKENINLVTILYDESGAYEHDLENLYIHGFEERLIQENHSRWLMCVVDSKEVLYASIPNERQTTAINTENQSMVWFASEYVKHDAYCLRLLSDFEIETKSKYGPDFAGLRAIFNQSQGEK